METEVGITTSELSLHPDVVDGVELPQPEAEFHTDSGVDSGDDTPVMTPTTMDNWLVIYTHLCVK